MRVGVAIYPFSSAASTVAVETGYGVIGFGKMFCWVSCSRIAGGCGSVMFIALMRLLLLVLCPESLLILLWSSMS